MTLLLVSNALLLVVVLLQYRQLQAVALARRTHSRLPR